jgi:hypothetical protein
MAEAKEADRFGLAERLQRDMKRYLDQFLIDVFVRLGLIPTYSFPVDDVRLEARKELSVCHSQVRFCSASPCSPAA